MNVILKIILIPLLISLLFFFFVADLNFFIIFKHYIENIFKIKITNNEYKVIGSLLLIIIYFSIYSVEAFKSYFQHETTSTTHGSARWATVKELTPLNKGILLGKIKGKPVRTTYNVLVCAPSRSGKGVSSIIPNLLDHPGSAVILDVKGENFRVTARERRKYGKVFVLDPFQVCSEKSHSLNFLDSIKIDQTDCFDQAKILADMICQSEKKDFFEGSAKKLIAGLILYICFKSTDSKKRNITSVIKFLNNDTESFIKILEDMYSIDELKGYAVAALDAYKNDATREFSGVINTARDFASFLGDKRVSETLCSSDFDFEKLKKEVFTVYIIIPPKYITAYSAYIRCIFTLALNAVMNDYTQPKEKVLFVLDEFPQLGYMKNFEDAISVIAGYGGQILLFVQDLSQLESKYKNYNTFLSNSDRVFFGCNDYNTAKYISNLLGEETIVQKSISENNGKNSISYSETGRHLLKPNEVINLKDRIIFFNSKSRPSLLEKVIYYNDKKYKCRFDKNPYI